MAKQYISVERTLSPRPRSKRRRETGEGGSSTNVTVVQNGGGSSPASVIGDGHTHDNKSTLDKLGIDAEGYVTVTGWQENEEGGLEKKTSKSKAGYADKSGTAQNLAEDSSDWKKILRKDQDDEAAGLIGFLRGIWIGIKGKFGWTAEGDITARSIEVERFRTEKFEADEAQINEIRSDNYSGTGMNGTGFIITRWHDGRSFIAVDDLEVRGQMTVSKLEIREETYTGGNQHWSPAGSVLYRVDYLDENDEALGYSEFVSPLTLNGEPFLTGDTQDQTILYATSSQIREAVGNDILRVKKFRCYIVADNGTTSTRNFWKVGDLARCQTYNIVKREERDGETVVGAIQGTDPVTDVAKNDDPLGDEGVTMENVYFWRLVTAVGAARLDDGKTYNYIDLSNEHVVQDGRIVKKTFADGSDIPAAGDTLVCFGNDRDIDRMGIISIETYNSAGESGETPAMKMYAGVNGFSLDGKRTAIISPGRVEFLTSIFRLITHDGSVVPVQNPRGQWRANTPYHYFDVVQHNGSSYLCIVDDTYYWIEGTKTPQNFTAEDWANFDPATLHAYNEGKLNVGESGFEGSKGHPLADSSVTWTLVYNFTTAEPGTAGSEGVWSVIAAQGPKGDKGDPMDLDDLDEEERQALLEGIAGLVESGLTVIIEPQVIIVSQKRKGEGATAATLSGNRTAKVRILRDGSKVPITLVSNSVRLYDSSGSIGGVASGSVNAGTNELTVTLESLTWSQNITTGRYEYADDNGTIVFQIIVDGDTEHPYALSVKWYLNRLGSRIEETEGDMKSTFMSRTEYALAGNNSNLLSRTKNPESGNSQQGYWYNASGGTFPSIGDSPVDDYTTAFHVENSSTTGDKYWLQTLTVWSMANTFTFSAYVRAIDTSATAYIGVLQGSNSSVFEKTVPVGTEWTYISFVVSTPDFNEESIINGNFCLGVRGMGKVEFIAPCLVRMFDGTVIRNEYKGLIRSSASGFETRFESIEENASEIEQRVSTVEQTAEGLTSTVETLGGSVSRIQQKSDSISLGVMGGGIVVYSDSSERSMLDSSSSADIYNAAYNHIAEVADPGVPYWVKLSCEIQINASSTTGYAGVYAALQKSNGSGFTVNANAYSPQSAKGRYIRFEGAVQVTGYKLNSIAQLQFFNTTGYRAYVRNIKLAIVGEAEGGLAMTGIIVTDGRIDMQADKFSLRNGRGEQTMGVDANGDVEVAGTVRAKNLYHGICVNGLEEWCYVTMSTDGTQERGWTVGTYQRNETPGSGIDGTVVCTYSADIVIVPNRHNNSNARYVNLPRSRDFEGKIVEVYDNAYSNGQAMGAIMVSAVDGGRFSNGFGYTGVDDGDSGQSVTLAAGSKAKFYSVKSGSTWYWVKLEG